MLAQFAEVGIAAEPAEVAVAEIECAIQRVGGELNGPVIGAIFTIVGFAAYGKHPRNIVPIMAGVFLGSLAKPWNVDDPSILLAALFVGTLLAREPDDLPGAG